MMSSDGSISLMWGDGEYRFRLTIGELRELQDKCNAGPTQVLVRLARNEWLIDDIIQTLRLGLIGGGMDATRALAKVSKFITPGAIASQAIPALQVLQAALFPAEDDAPGKPDAAAAAAMRTEKSDGHSTSAVPQQWAGRSNNLTAIASGSSPQPSMDGMPATAVRNGQDS